MTDLVTEIPFIDEKVAKEIAGNPKFDDIEELTRHLFSVNQFVIKIMIDPPFDELEQKGLQRLGSEKDKQAWDMTALMIYCALECGGPLPMVESEQGYKQALEEIQSAKVNKYIEQRSHDLSKYGNKKNPRVLGLIYRHREVFESSQIATVSGLFLYRTLELQAKYNQGIIEARK